MRVQPRWVLAILLVCGCANASSVYAQRSGQPEKTPIPDTTLVDDLTPHVTVFPLRMVDAAEAAKVLQQLISKEVRIVVDPRTNGIIVSGKEADVKVIAELLKVLDSDRARQEPAGPEIKLFTLKQPIDSSLNEVLNVVKSDETNVAVDYLRNVVIAKGNPTELAQIEATLMRLDTMYQERVDEEKARAEQRGKLSARFVWLVAGLEEGKLKAPPADLQPVIDELGKIGVTDLKLAAQMLIDVNGDSESPFNATGIAKLDRPANLSISGLIKEGKDDRIGLQIQISADQEPAPATINEIRGNPSAFAQRGRSSRNTLCELQTTVLTRPGHAIVLGVTPAGDMTSVFVVQLRDGKQ